MEFRTIDELKRSLKTLSNNITVNIDSQIQLAEDFERKKESDKVSKLENSVKEMVEKLLLLKHQLDALENIQKAQGGKFQDLLRKHQVPVEEDDYRTHQKFLEFKQRVWAIHHPNQPLPDDEDTEVFAMPAAESFICPLTKKEFVHPVKCSNCPHVFERDAILNWIKTKRHGPRGTPVLCPQAGCRQTVAEGSLSDAVDVARRLRKKKEELEDENSSDDDHYTQL